MFTFVSNKANHPVISGLQKVHVKKILGFTNFMVGSP